MLNATLPSPTVTLTQNKVKSSPSPIDRSAISLRCVEDIQSSADPKIWDAAIDIREMAKISKVPFSSRSNEMLYSFLFCRQCQWRMLKSSNFLPLWLYQRRLSLQYTGYISMHWQGIAILALG